MSDTSVKAAPWPRRIGIFALQLAAVAALIGADQWLKHLVTVSLKGRPDRTLIPGLYALTYTENTGAAFSMFSNNTFILTGVTVVLLVLVLAALLFRYFPGRLASLSMILILAGGTGNLIDRIRQHYVVDYIRTLFVDFAVYNFADMLVVVGVALLAFCVVWLAVKERREKKEAPRAAD